MKRWILLLFGIVNFYANAQFNEQFIALKQSAAMKSASVGVCFIDVSNGEMVFGENEHTFFYPASIQKIITTATALNLLGADYRYETSAYCEGEITWGVLNGNITIESVGDPTINSAYFKPNFKADLIQGLESKGIKTIKGDVKFNSKSSDHLTPQSWLYEDIGNYYGVAPQLFNYKDNLYYLTFQQKGPDEIPAIINVQPEVPYVFNLEIVGSHTVKGDQAYILGSPFTLDREIVGTIPAGVGTFTIKGANANPQFTFTEEIKKELNDNIHHIELLSPSNQQKLSSTKSPPLSEIVKTTNFESVNLFAEGILNTLGLVFANSYTTQAGITVVEEYISQRKLNTKQISLKDGSGLSRLNAMTPHFAANWICTHFEEESFRNSLPVSGVSGTLRYLNHVGIKGVIHAKSGSAEGVVNYAGYLKAADGKTYAFAIFINHAYQSRYSIRREIGVFLEKFV